MVPSKHSPRPFRSNPAGPPPSNGQAGGIEPQIAEIRLVAYATLFLATITAGLVLGFVLKTLGY